MTRTFVQRGALLVAAVIGLIGSAPRSASAQKALVYCPVNVDATGCTTIVNALTGPMFPLGVDKGYDGTNGTVDLKTVDLFSYSVFVVPSLADGASSQPYARLRDPEVVEHLKAALIGRIAMWSGTPDQGATNRGMKDALIQNLTGWVGGAYATAKGPGLVSLLDASASVVTRYDWVRAIAPLPVTSDANLLIYNGVRSLNQRATSILTSGAGAIVYDNMATFGFQVPNGAAGVSLDAVGQTGTTQGGQVVLLTMEAGNASGATVKTDRDDYAPGEIVTITGTGWQAGEQVKLTLHMDPLRDSDTELTATADGNGNIVNTEFSPGAYDIGVRFVLTAVGQASGSRAQTTFTDGNKVTFSLTAGGIEAAAFGTINQNACFSAFVQERQGSNLDPAPPGGRVVTLTSSASAGSTTFFTGSACAGAGVSTVTIPATESAVVFSFRVSVTGGPFTISGSGAGLTGTGNQAVATVSVTAAGNAAPVLGAIGDKSVGESALLQFTATASDANSPAQTLTYSLDAGAPAGATINSSTGQFNWTPSESQGGATYPVTIRVTDNGSPVLDDFETFNITVNEINVAPVLDAIGSKNVNELATLSFNATASDADLPANSLTFSLAAGTDQVPAGASISSAGAFSWTPTEDQGPGTYKFKVVVTDNGSPNLTDDEEITVTVAEVNVAPVLANIGNKNVDELATLSFTATATDADLPANGLTFTLVGAPEGAAITSAGAFTWTPTETQGPGTYTFTVKVTDDGSPNLVDDETITVTVSDVNVAPVLDPIGSKTVDEKTLLTFTATASDADIPANSLTFALAAGTDPVPSGANISSAGVFTWTPSEAQGPGVYNFKVRVSDNGTPVLADDEEITITVNEVNEAPELGAIGNKNVNEESLLTFTASAADPDDPANTLSYSLVGAPAGAAIDPSTGVFTWTPTETQGPGSHTFTVKVMDNGSPAASDEESITVTVAEVNRAPTVATIPAKTVNEGATLTFTAMATDPDVPANSLTFSLVSPPAGATINPTTGEFSWTPGDGPATVNITVRATDNGSPVLYDDETFTVTVNNVDPTATFTAPAGPISEGASIAMSFSSPVDVLADLPTIKYAFDCGTGLGYGAASATTATTCPAPDNPGQVVKGKVIDKDGGFTEYTRTVIVSNVAPVLGSITIAPNAVVQVNTTITASAPFTDAGVNDTHTGTFVWDDATPNTTATVTETNGSGSASTTHTYTVPGVYEVALTLRDKDGAEVGTTFQYVVVYDPNGGFVTGGGWIDSPLNACQLTSACKSLTGKANFGFVSKYKKGQSTPEGNTEFQFKAGDINFHSEVYEWLVVAGARAQFKGTGTINGSGNYGFMLTSVDGQVSGGGGIDKFRIKIWDKNDADRVVYDNQLTAPDDAALTTVLGGGSINIQSK